MIKKLLSIPKTIYFNFRVFPYDIAKKLPIFIAYNVKVKGYRKNCVTINGDISRFMIKINSVNGSDGINHSLNSRGFLSIGKNGRIIFNGKAEFARGISIRVGEGKLVFGDNFSCNRNCFFTSSSNVEFGDNVLIGWNVNVRDSDGHKVYNSDGLKVDNSIKPVYIGNNVWIAANVDILKGVKIMDNTVVAYRSCVTKEMLEGNCIIAGFPAKIIKNNILWEK